MESATKEFVQSLVSTNPSLEPIYAEHLKDYDELLPHVFFGDVTLWIINHFDTDQASVSEIIDFLDRGYYDVSDEVNELISVSFFENFENTELNTYRAGYVGQSPKCL